MTSQLTDGEYCLKTNFEQNDVSLFYVKLTKSADRAINEYLRNPNKFKNEPSILFTKRNEGQISIPIASSHNGKVLKEPLKFEFSVTIDADVEKRSLFECYHYERSKVLKRTGSLKCKLCIHANDDIYETTKNRMAAIEEQQKAKRTRELDWSYATGKKIKVDSKKSVVKISAETNVRNFSQTPSASNNNNNNNNVNNSSSSSSSSNSNSNSSNSVNNVTYNRADANNKSKPNENNKKMSDILLMRKPLKERMLHMLAVKPYSKQELFNAINMVSIQPNDVTRLTNTLSALAVVCDNNLYDLSKEKWTDVHEDWPFYTADERQQVKKRKRLILASATSPSPPLPNNNLPSPTNKRQENGGDSGTCNSSPDYTDSRSKLVPPKYSANSHYKNCSTNSSSFNKSLPSIPAPDVDKPGPPFSRPGANQDQLIPSPVNEITVGGDGSGNSKRRRISHFTTRENSTTNVAALAVRNTHNPSVARILPTAHVRQVANKTVVSDKESGFPDRSSSFASVDEQHQPERAGVQFGSQAPMTALSSLSSDESSNFSTAYSKSALTVHPMKKENVRICVPDSTQDSPVNGIVNDLPALPNGVATNDAPLYEFNYAKVTSIEQRRKYKEDFNQTYREYKELHNEVDSVRISFLALGNELKKHPTDSANYKKLESKVYDRYNYLKKDSRFKMVKRRFEYLHEKLALIKGRIQEYDDTIVNDST